jgi:tetratricopeptide (TPR) repeat protein
MAKARAVKKTENRPADKRPHSLARYKTWGAIIVVAAVAITTALWVRTHYTIDPALLARDTEGVHLMQEGKDVQAVAIWNTLIAQAPNYPDPYVQIAAYDNMLDNPDRALALLQQLQKRRLWTPQAQVELADTYVQLKDPRGLKAAQQAVQVAPNSPRAHMALGTLYARMYGSDRALQEVAIAQKLNPKDASLYVLAAELYQGEHEPDQVESEARKCIAVAPNTAEAWYLLGWALEQNPSPDNFTQAAAAFKRSAELNPTPYNSWMELGSMLMQLGRRQQAQPALERARIQSTKLLPQEPLTQDRLQQRIRIDHLLLEIYVPQGNKAKVADLQHETDQLSAQIRAMQHKSAPPSSSAGS